MGTATISRSAALALALGLTAGLLAAACNDGIDVHCGPGTELVAKRCVPVLTGDGGPSEPPAADAGAATCGEGTYDLNGRCVGLKSIGAACESGLECVSGSCLSPQRGTPGGYCTVAACSDNRPCPAGSHCTYSSRAEMTLCLATCDGDDDCRAGDYVCQPLYTTDVHVCAPRCSDESCPSGTRCGPSGTCVIHGCVQGASDACGEDGSDLVCYPDRLGLGFFGGVCLHGCDPREPDAACTENEICQPLAADPERAGVCVPPACERSADCPAGATCMDRVCQPPARCDEDGVCADESAICVGGPGGQCMPPCADDADCGALHPGLSCSSALGACLPTGSFPGSVCRSDLDSPCDPLTVRSGDDAVAQTAMLCEDGLCLASCAQGGDALCADIAATLSCAEDVLDAPVCLPSGTYPGGPCDGEQACAPLATAGGSLAMACERDQCLITCDAAAGGDVLCAGVDASLVCAEDLFGDGIDVCLPRGAIPGGPCAAGDACDEGLVCEDGMCLYDCSAGGDPLCDGVRETLACARGIYDRDVCLPEGSFPGGPCAAGGLCAQDLGGLDAADMICSAGLCLIQCADAGPFSDGDALCATVDSALTCVTSAPTPFCAPVCVAGECPAGRSCLQTLNACLPTGSFPGSPCAVGDSCGAGLACEGGTCLTDCSAGGQAVCDAVSSTLACATDVYDTDVCLPKGSFPGGPCAAGDLCAQNLGGLAPADMFCSQGVCLIQCQNAAPLPDGESVCAAIDSALTCVTSPATDFCAPACVSNQCPPGRSCLTSENACLPTGSFLGSPCAGGTACSGEPDLVCVPGGTPTCAAGCSPAGAPSAYCQAVGSSYGTGYDTCADVDPTAGTLLICIDGTP